MERIGGSYIGLTTPCSKTIHRAQIAHFRFARLGRRGRRRQPGGNDFHSVGHGWPANNRTHRTLRSLNENSQLEKVSCPPCQTLFNSAPWWFYHICRIVEP